MTRANKLYSMFNKKTYSTCNIPDIDRLLAWTLSLTVYPFFLSEKEIKQDNDFNRFAM